MALSNYPATLDSEVWTVIYNALKGQIPTSTAHAVHCVYEAIGFGLGKFVPDVGAAHPVLSTMYLDWNSYPEGLECIHRLADPQMFGAAPEGFTIPWNLILPILFDLLSKLLIKS